MINSKFLKNKLCYLIILTGLIFSIYNSFQIVLKNDYFFERDDGSVRHRIIHSSVKGYWDEAHLFKKDLEENKSIFESGGELEMDYLYPKLIAFYYKIIDEEIKDDKNNFILKNYKFGIPIIQSITYFLALLFFFKKIRNKFNKIVLVSIIGFLTFEPSLITYHSSFWSESIYCSLLLLLFVFFINCPKEYYKYFFIGLLLGFLYMQRSATLLLIIPLSFYLILFEKKRGVIQSTLMIFGYALILGFIGFNEYKKSGVFYFTPHTQGDAHWHYVSHKLNAKKYDLTNAESIKKKNEDLESWIRKNDIKPNILEDKRKILNYKKSYFLDSLKGNYIEYLKLHVYKSLQFFTINFSHTLNHLTIDKSAQEWWKTDEFKKYFKIQIFYSLIIYLVCFFGFLNLILNYQNKKLASLIILVVVYYTTILGWTGISRYNVPNLLFISIFFGFGISYISNKLQTFVLIK